MKSFHIFFMLNFTSTSGVLAFNSLSFQTAMQSFHIFLMLNLALTSGVLSLNSLSFQSFVQSFHIFFMLNLALSSFFFVFSSSLMNFLFNVIQEIIFFGRQWISRFNCRTRCEMSFAKRCHTPPLPHPSPPHRTHTHADTHT